MEKLNLIENAEVEILNSKNSTVININVGLHPKDERLLMDNIFTFLKSCSKSKEFIKSFNIELDGMGER